jgi:hypothetical protein
MHFVTTKRPEYTLFCMSPSERFAIGLDEHQVVSFFVRGPAKEWQLARRWDGGQFSHTAFMAALRSREEPNDPLELLALLPPELPSL